MEGEKPRAEQRILVDQISSPNFARSRDCERCFNLCLILSLSLLSVLLLTGIIVLDAQYRGIIVELISVHDELSDNLQFSKRNISHLIDEKIQLERLLTEQNQELKTLQSFSRYDNECPIDWIKFNGSYYYVSIESLSWDEARKDCRENQADLVVIDSHEEQWFVSNLTTKVTWIGLSDKAEEGVWKWVDGSSLTVQYWASGQPDNGHNFPGIRDEDCAHFRPDKFWNDFRCPVPLKWICERKMFQ